jgi:hypothetical protein
MPFQGKGAESIKTKKQLQRLADSYGISLKTRTWGSVKTQVKRGVVDATSGDVGDFALVLYEKGRAVAVVDLATLFELANS